ncbi:hypothetical protein V3N99_17610 [Dermatophilaceae bacterium Soc4.6]
MTTAALCPRCQQDDLRFWTLVSTNEQIALCPECDATWLAEQTPTLSTYTDFEDFLATRGLPYSFDTLRADT